MVRGELQLSETTFGQRQNISPWCVLLCCLLSTGIWAQPAAYAEAESAILLRQQQEQFWSYLETSDHIQLRTASAIYLLQKDDPAASKRGEDLIDEVLRSPFLDAVSLWLLASDCQWRPASDWCETGAAFDLLTKADSENAAVYVLQLNQTGLEDDSGLLLKAANADHFDAYWARGVDKLYDEALEYLENNPPPPEYLDGNWEIFSAADNHVHAFLLIMGPVMMPPTPGYQRIINLCRNHARNQQADNITACKKLAMLMQNKGYTYLTRAIGLALERAMVEEVDPNDPRVEQLVVRRDILQDISMCQSADWQFDEQRWLKMDESVFRNWAKNVSELGEWEGNKLSAIEEYNASPGVRDFNPAECAGRYERP